MKKLKIALLPALLCLGLLWTNDSAAQGKKKSEKISKAGHSSGFTKLESGLEYKIVRHGNGTHKPQLNDHIEMHISYQVAVPGKGDSLLFDSRKMSNDKPVPYQITKPRGPGDPVEVFMLMVAGDSAVIRYPVESLKKLGQCQPWMDTTGAVEYHVSLISVRSDAEEKKEAAEKAEKQKSIDDKILQDYFAQHGLKPKKTASGLYYTISSTGQADKKVTAGKKVNVNYTGMFLDGKKFDSNTDSSFHHPTPFPLEVGKGAVIKGWDEGLQLLNVGGKATLYIPSTLAYGGQERGPIPANSILVFDVEILDLPDQDVIDEKLIKDYIAKNNIKATRTASGLYYVINQKGLGPFAKPGKKVTMNYTGKTLDGNVFDSNLDPKFNHVQPFSFQLGAGQVIKGWDEGVQLLNMGSRATLIIPSGLAYGPSGNQGIPPNAVLLFDVELVSIDK
jgi:FKBP-type peptidyl-prolyl cis-trans isomerase FkpA